MIGKIIFISTEDVNSTLLKWKIYFPQIKTTWWCNPNAFKEPKSLEERIIDKINYLYIKQKSKERKRKHYV